jgi:hypothetical protein
MGLFEFFRQRFESSGASARAMIRQWSDEGVVISFV